MGWADVWMPAARASLTQLRGQAVSDSDGLAVPALSPVDATAMLSIGMRAAIGQLTKLQADGQGCATQVQNVSVGNQGAALGAVDGYWEPNSLADQWALGRDDPATLTAPQYLAAFPPPPGRASESWLRSPHNYATLAFAGVPVLTDDDGTAAFSAACGGEISDGGPVYVVYTSNRFDDGGVLGMLHQLVSCYQAACDAVAAGTLGVATTSSPMDSTSLLAFWSAMQRMATTLDVLQDVPPRPSTTAAFEELGHDVEQYIVKAAELAGKAAAELANQVGKAAGAAISGVGQGLDAWGLAVGIGILAVFFALR